MSDAPAAESESRRIVVGVDGSEESQRALRWAVDLARCTRAVIDAVIAWDVATGYGWAAMLPEDYDPAKDAQRALDAAIDEALGAEPDVTIRRIAEQGPAGPVLLQASKGASELVVGSRGHGGFTGLLLGSVSTYCVHHASCPVVVVRVD